MPSSILLVQAPIACALLLGLLLVELSRRRKGSKIPTIRRWPAPFPEILDRLSYNRNAVALVREGYTKHKNVPFRLLKMDMDLVVIPLKYAAELRAVTSDKLDPLTASFDDNAGHLTKILLGSELHSDAIHRPRIIPVVVDELKFAFDHVLAQGSKSGKSNSLIINQTTYPLYLTDSWTAVNPYDMVLDLSTRAAARIFVGEPICRDEQFLQTTASYSRNSFSTIDTFRNLGSIIGLFGRAMSSTVTDARDQLAYVQRLLGDEVTRRRARPDDKHDDFLQWCMDLARTPDESQPESIAHRTLGILSMAVVHTTAMASTHMLFDLVSDPDLLEALREEQRRVLPEGWPSINQKAMLEMRLLDSLMRESQRFNPVGEFTFRRIVRKPIVLSDGYQLQPGQQIAIPAKNLNLDDDIISEADAYNPSRWATQQQASASFAHSSSANLHFGLGRYACPGRFFAAYMIKSIMSRLLLEYDIKLQGDGCHRRPPNIISGDKILPNRDAVILLRHRDS
ncbi:hypothetical protein CDD80_6198 [Ophiocordyceps camponoti-rufipedis]|uniref:Cytochrome P450 monooxygenase n=1 Tax=Ophiocordyceps camponoti-rufipedis TaxID=2004952 RepID=A0A2C5ZCU4_9HYPO|nr:hypothetical protein CDD80_6198 [Ophiocordyceps camponoti-rufipedis]